MNKVILSGHIEVPEDEIEKIRDALPEHILNTQNESGCLIFEVKEESEKGKFSVYEEFDSKEAFLFHQKRVRESIWGSVTKNVTRHYKIEGIEE